VAAVWFELRYALRGLRGNPLQSVLVLLLITLGGGLTFPVYDPPRWRDG
jgi:hypothetical protein